MAALLILGILAVAFAVGAWWFFAHNSKGLGVTFVILSFLFVMIAIGVYPYANVWQKRLNGQAILAESEAARQVKVSEAQATLDSAKLLASAEVERARGVEQANSIIAGGLGGPEGYLRYLYIDAIKEAKGEGATIIYVATEAGMPVTEAGRFLPKAK